MYGWMMGAGGLWWVLWVVLALVVVAGAAVVLILTLARRPVPTAGSETPPREPTAREILDRRYARGEIDHDEYTRRRDELGRT
ncbi:SHOCT domain-containing protein [Microbacterium sp. X-17]|uniref:SHOCT domain-containing protein n=1 Tax=Microbacterium sp. X-17 TaxID=3144404 RepID=UPI0031F576E5